MKQSLSFRWLVVRLAAAVAVLSLDLVIGSIPLLLQALIKRGF